MRVVFALIIINKAGGLIYQRDFAEGLNKLSINDYLVLAGTFHGVHAITTRLYPVHDDSPPSKRASTGGDRPDPPSGLEVLETENFRLQCFQTLTGTKFLLFTEPMQPNVDAILRRIYELYADYVMKNPFYQTEMPVRCEVFDRKLGGYVRPLNSRFARKEWGLEKGGTQIAPYAELSLCSGLEKRLIDYLIGAMEFMDTAMRRTKILETIWNL
ncbi:hypothetical protein B7463_g7135, partial [Scytalidium lignicola]